MCRSSSEGGRRCGGSSLTCASRNSLLNRKRYLEAKGESTQDVEHELNLLNEAHDKYGDIVVSHTMEVDAATEALLDSLRGAGFNPLIVGGAVRDSLQSGVSPKDVDIEVHDVDSVDQVIRSLRRSGYRIDEVGRSFGVLKTVLPNGMDIDISLPRRDNLVGNGHRGFEVEVDPGMDVHEAASRRDFTINAMYYDHARHCVVDPYNGSVDLRKGVLRHVSDAYSEDPLRVLRGVQIASRFNLVMAPETVQASRDIKERYYELSNERVQEEWRKFMTKGGKNLRNGLQVLHETGWDEGLGLEGIDREKTADQAQRVYAAAERRGEDAEVFATSSFALQLPPSKRAEFIRTVLVGSRRQQMAASLASIEAPDDLTSRKQVKKWARQIDKKGVSIKQWETLHSVHADEHTKKYITRVADIARKNGCYEQAHPDLVTGQMVLEASGEGRGGRWVGEVIARAKKAQDDEVFMDAEGARQWLVNDLNSLRNVASSERIR